ncbi:MAG: GNAT family N-acetyltransferase [Verrucomicrobiales bacterium]|nr:GNAT family N-acetyltransferase [Verrucomicrobiales bacterium]
MNEIKELAPGESLEWLRMRRALFPDCSTTMHDCEVAEIRAHPDRHAVLVYQRDEAANRLGGFVEVSIRDRVDGSLSGPVGYVEGWYVDPDLRGGGIGRALLEAAERWASERGLSELASDCELNNSSALAAHQALGFRETFRLVHLLKPLVPKSP